MGKDDPIGCPDPFAQKVIKIDGVSSVAMDAPQVSPVQEFSPTVDEVRNALCLDDDNDFHASEGGGQVAEGDRARKIHLSRTSNGTNPLQKSTSAPPQTSKVACEQAGGRRLKATKIVLEAGQKRALSPGQKQATSQQSRRVSRKSLDKQGPRRSLPSRAARPVQTRRSGPLVTKAPQSEAPVAKPAVPEPSTSSRAPAKTNLQREAELGLTCIRCKNSGRVAITSLGGKNIGRCGSCKYTSTPTELLTMQREAAANCPAAFTQKKLSESIAQRATTEKDDASKAPMDVTQNAQPSEKTTESVANVMLITESEWSALLQTVEDLKKDSETKERRLTELEATVQYLQRENSSLKRAAKVTNEEERPATTPRRVPQQQKAPLMAPPKGDSAVRALQELPQEPDAPLGQETKSAVNDSPPSFLQAAKANWSPDVMRRLIEARTELIKANFVRQRKLKIRAFYFRNAQRGKISDLRSILAKVLPWECRVGISFIGGSIVEILADIDTAKRIYMVDRLNALRWKFVPDYDIFSDSLKKTTTDLSDTLRTLKNLEMVKHRTSLCLKYVRNPDAEDWYNGKLAEAERRIAELPPITDEESNEGPQTEHDQTTPMDAEPAAAAPVDADGFTLVTRRSSKPKSPARASAQRV